VASREEQKRKAREEREAKEREERESKAKRSRLIRIGVGAAVVVVAAIIAVVALSGGSSKKAAATGNLGQDGMQNTPGPWNSGTDGLEARTTKLGLPDPSDTVFHIHANLAVYADGKKQTVPQNVGIDSDKQFLASLHTHDDQGVIHMEAVQPYPFKLGQFFTIWGVPFTTTQLGSYHVGQGLVLQTWVNGKQVKDGPTYVMKPHDRILVGFGRPGSFPTKNNFKFPPGE
jgi:hypothetical protein